MSKYGTWLVVLALILAALAFFYIKNGLTESKPLPEELTESDPLPEENPLEGISESQLFTITRRTEGGAVTVDVAFLNILKPDEKDLLFYVALNTHTVDLTSYEIEKLAVLTNGKITVEDGFIWESIQDDGHHRFGILRVKNNGIFDKNTDYIELNLRGIAGVPDRKYRWDKKDWGR